MKIIKQSWQWIQTPVLSLDIIEQAGRTCYKSKKSASEQEVIDFVSKLIKRGHMSVIEHVSASVRFITNRGVTHELVRHRLASYSQESTRYVNYKNKGIEFIRPCWWESWTDREREVWLDSMRQAEKAYTNLLGLGSIPEQAREVLPNSLKTEIVMTANLREWRHVFTLRCNKRAHPQIRELMLSCLAGFKDEIPVIFNDI